MAQVVDDAHVNALPNTAAWFLGLANLRGNLVPVFDIARYLAPASAEPVGPANAPREVFQILVVGRGPDAVGIVVSGYPRSLGGGLTDVPHHVLEATVRECVPDRLSRFVRRAVSTDEQLWFEIDFEAFFMSVAEQVAL